ncbi:MAG: hypothetical protein ABSG15_08985 [FCB group bacterium]|jgi:hypothetical protein
MIELDEIIKFEKNMSNKISVQENLLKPHSITQILIRNKPKEAHYSNHLFNMNNLILVSEESVKRALRIFDTFVKALEKRKYLNLEKENKNIASIDILGETLQFRIKEKLKRIDFVPNDKQKKSSWFNYVKYDYTPTGILILQLVTWTPEGSKRNLSDGKTKIEDKLNDFIIECAKAAVLTKIHTEEMRLMKIEWEEKWKLKEEKERKKIREEENIELLLKQTKEFSQNKQIVHFIKAIQDSYKEKNINSDDNKKINEWLEWANKVEKKLNPVDRFNIDDYYDIE